MKNPGRTFAVLLLTAVVILLALMRFGPKYLDEETPVVTPTPTPLPVYPRMQTGKPTRWAEPDHAIFESNDVINVAFSGGVSGDWLIVHRTNKHYDNERSFDPCYTTILSDFRPVVKKYGAKWVIQFETRDITTEFQP